MSLTSRRATIAMALALAATAPAVAACSSPTPVVYEPAAFGPTVGGSVYCGYWYSPLERAGQDCIPAQFPAAPPLLADPIGYAVWHDLMTYPTYYYGESYYDRRISPVRSRSTVFVIERTTFVDNGRQFNQRNHAEETIASRSAPYKTPGSSKIYRGDKYAASANKAAAVTYRKTVKPAGGNAPRVTDPGRKTAPKVVTDNNSDTRSRSRTTNSGGKTGSNTGRSSTGGSVTRK